MIIQFIITKRWIIVFMNKITFGSNFLQLRRLVPNHHKLPTSRLPKNLYTLQLAVAYNSRLWIKY